MGSRLELQRHITRTLARWVLHKQLAHDHTWRWVWSPNGDMELWLDDLRLNGSSPFSGGKLQHLRLNLAVGGDHGGEPPRDKDCTKFCVREVRLYQGTALGTPSTSTSAQPQELDTKIAEHEIFSN